MNKQIILNFTCIAVLLLPFASYGAIYKHVDENGRVTYSNVKIKGGKKMKLEPADTSFGTGGSSGESEKKAKTKKSSPKSFPKVDAKTQQNRDSARKQILLDELASQKKALEAAKEAYKQGESDPEVFTRKNANGTTSTGRNVARYQEKLKRLQETVDSHQRNIDHLNKEISNIN